MADDNMCDLTGRPGFLGVVPNEDLGAGSQSVCHAVGIEQARHDPTEDVPTVDERQCLAHSANIFYDETPIFVRRLFDHAPCPAKRDVTVDLGDQVKTPIGRAFSGWSVCFSQTLAWRPMQPPRLERRHSYLPASSG